MDDFGLQHRVQIIDAGSVAVLQTRLAMAFLKGKAARAINGDDKLPLQAEAVEHLVAHELAHTLVAQIGQGGRANMAEEVIQRFMDRQGLLLGFGQLIDVVQDGQFGVPELVVERAPAPQFQGEQKQSPPDQEAFVIDNHFLETGVRKFIEPRIKVRPEVPQGPHKGLAQC